MKSHLRTEPATTEARSSTVLHYVDPVEGFDGYVVYDRDECRLAAGGCRVQPGLTAQVVRELAADMTLKHRIVGVNVDGVKCGIDYDPRARGKNLALRRFLAFLREDLQVRLSLGPDMGTRWADLERLAAAECIPSVKYAIKTAQGLSEEEFFARLRLLEEPVGSLTLGQRRAGHALAHATMAAAEHSGHRVRSLTCGLQGFGNLGRAAACSLAEHGVRIAAVADVDGCVVDPAGLDIARMLATAADAPVTGMGVGASCLPRETLLEQPVDVLIVAAVENGLDEGHVAALPAAAVVVGANHGLAPSVERALAHRGILVVPDFVAGSGGPASMEAVFGPQRRPTPTAVLELAGTIVRELVGDVLDGARRGGLLPRQVALDMVRTSVVRSDAPPYGRSPYASGPPPSGRRWHRVSKRAYRKPTERRA